MFGIEIVISDNLPPDFYELDMPGKSTGFFSSIWQRLMWKRIIRKRRESAIPVVTQAIMMGNKIIMTNQQHRQLIRECQ